MVISQFRSQVGQGCVYARKEEVLHVKSGRSKEWVVVCEREIDRKVVRWRVEGMLTRFKFVGESLKFERVSSEAWRRDWRTLQVHEWEQRAVYTMLARDVSQPRCAAATSNASVCWHTPTYLQRNL